MNNRFILLSVILFISFSLISCSGDDNGGTAPASSVYDGNWSQVYSCRLYDPVGGGYVDKVLESKLYMNLSSFSLNIYDDENNRIRSESGTFETSADTIWFTVNPGGVSTRVYTLKHDVMSKIKIYYTVMQTSLHKANFGSSGFLWGGDYLGYTDISMIQAGLFEK